ncbi:uncharacterized protein CMU_039930 [Cryptosporidium muris RN66]|uniref:Uncharacterized protein n=1 Tax=Cryptosporidium muris (strain RN66) TaxID=441375 RepID=B6A9N3_CRYMR|nr:uncharacterized protein CMU_039930 [Cryptosporidium muris RN66]EEA04924.1 hypothetical protein CMU_039930 [Cryptosporidium muris RN66]|eukprot:XP_002139273.1 hypothetical protein [Cryptosporidium muris RN66]
MFSDLWTEGTTDASECSNEKVFINYPLPQDLVMQVFPNLTLDNTGNIWLGENYSESGILEHPLYREQGIYIKWNYSRYRKNLLSISKDLAFQENRKRSKNKI